MKQTLSAITSSICAMPLSNRGLPLHLQTTGAGWLCVHGNDGMKRAATDPFFCGSVVEAGEGVPLVCLGGDPHEYYMQNGGACIANAVVCLRLLPLVDDAARLRRCWYRAHHLVIPDGSCVSPLRALTGYYGCGMAQNDI
jgi:hypothetical protein